MVRYGHRDDLEVCCRDSKHPSNRISQPYVSQIDLQGPRVKLLTYLMQGKGFSLTALVRGRFQLADVIWAEVERLRQQAMKKGFQGWLFEMAVPKL